MRRLAIPLLVFLIAAVTLWQREAGPGAAATLRGEQTGRVGAGQARSGLPSEALETLDLISQGGPFPYRKDGSVFQNREGRLPDAARGHYREYTVPTPGARDRGARRIVTGGTPPSAWYYTDDHYRSFRDITAAGRGAR